MKIIVLAKSIALAAFFVSVVSTPVFSARAETERFLNIQPVTSDGGITAWFLEDHSVPVIAVEFAFVGAGTALDPVDKQGLARLLSNTMDEGADDLNAQAFQKALTDNSITLNFDVGRDNFFGGFKSLTKHHTLAADLMRKALTAPRFEQNAIDRMKAANISRIRSQLSDPDWMAARLMNDVNFTGHPYAMNSGGTISGINAVTADDLKNFAATRFSRGNLLVAVTGDITADELKPLLDHIFGQLPETADIPQIADTQIQNGNTITLLEYDVPQTSIHITQPGIDRKDPDYPAAQIMNFILGSSGFGSRLTDEIREKRGLTYGIYSMLYQLKHVTALSVTTATRNDKTAEVLDLIKAEWQKMRDHPVSVDELNAARDYITGSMPLALTSTKAIANLILGLQMDNLPIDYLDTVKQRYATLSVDDIQRVSQRILTPDNLSIVVVGNPSGITPTTIRESLPYVD